MKGKPTERRKTIKSMKQNVLLDIMSYSWLWHVSGLFHCGWLSNRDGVPALTCLPLRRKDSAKEKSMISGAHRSVPPLRVGLHAHQKRDTIPVIVLREIQFARPVEKMEPIKLHRTADNTVTHQRWSKVERYGWCFTVVMHNVSSLAWVMLFETVTHVVHLQMLLFLFFQVSAVHTKPQHWGCKVFSRMLHI